jgi:hypothetical protein
LSNATHQQPAHAFDFADLVGDAVFELLVKISKLLRLSL